MCRTNYGIHALFIGPTIQFQLTLTPAPTKL